MSDLPQVLLAHHLKALKLPTILREYEKVARQCAAEGVDFIGFLLRLLEAELIERERHSVQRRIRAARFPVVKSLDTFDFAATPMVSVTPKPLISPVPMKIRMMDEMSVVTCESKIVPNARA